MTRAVVIAGTRSGVGKTTIATGIMAALARRGHKVQPFKCGPDYIDPSYHTLACGVPSRNLDTWLLAHETVRELFHRAASNADFAVIEGVMGLYDGRSSLTEEGSTAEVAKLLGAPVILVTDAAKVARSVAAEVLGFQKFDPAVNIVGVILNGIGSKRHLDFCKPAIEAATGLPVLGYMPRRDEVKAPERHLGLVPTAEGPVADQWLDTLSAQIEETVSIQRIIGLASAVGNPVFATSVFPDTPVPARAAIAVAQDKAFNFYYQDSLDLLSAWGAEIRPFSPLADSSLPDDVGAVYLGGGFPEVFARELAENVGMKRSIARAAASGVPVYAECGGLMYLGREIVDFDGASREMAGLIPVRSSMSNSRLSLGYREVEALSDGPVLDKGQRVRGHEFHWSSLEEPLPERSAAYRVLSQNGRLEGFRHGSIWASYIHVHLGSGASLAPRFVESAARSHARLASR